MAADPLRVFPASGSTIYVQWEVENDDGAIKRVWFRAKVKSSNPSDSVRSAVAIGTIVYDEYDPDTNVIVCFLTRKRVSVLYAPDHPDPTPCPWCTRPDNSVDDSTDEDEDEDFVPPGGSYDTERTNDAALSSVLVSDVAKLKADLLSLRSTVNAIAANVFTHADLRTGELSRELMSQLRVELIHLLAKPSQTHARRFSKKQTNAHHDTLSYGEIIRSYESASFRVSFNLFRKFVSDRDATLHTSTSARPIYDPPLPFSAVVPERGRVYTVVFRSFAGMSAWVGMTDPAIQAKALVRTKHGILRVLGSLVADPSTRTIVPSVPKTPVLLPTPSSFVSPGLSFSGYKTANGQAISLPKIPSMPRHVKPSPFSSTKITNGQAISLGPLPSIYKHGKSSLSPPKTVSFGYPKPAPPVSSVKPLFSPHKTVSFDIPRPAPHVPSSNPPLSIPKTVSFDTPKPAPLIPSIKPPLSILKPVSFDTRKPAPSTPSGGPLYVFPGSSVQTVTKCEEGTEQSSFLPSLFISNSGYNVSNRSFCTPFVRREVNQQAVSVPRPGSPESRYNSFYISWELDAPPSNEFRNDLSVLTAFYGTLTLNIPTLSFKAPLTAARVKYLLPDQILRSILNPKEGHPQF